jgi:hypothetical protein
MSISEHPSFVFINKRPEYKHWVAVSTLLKAHHAPARMLDKSASAVLVVGIRFWGFKDPADAAEFRQWTSSEGHKSVMIDAPGPQLERVLLGL